MNHTRSHLLSTALSLCLSAIALPGCDSTPGSQDMSSAPDLAPAGDMAGATCMPFTGELAACTCSVNDYAPRYNASKDDTWPVCISDGNEFKLAGATPPGSAARTLAFDSMGTKLWKKATAPTMADFTAARDEYSISGGIGSRVSRRQDVHYPEPQGATSLNLACTEANFPTMYPDRCAGPAKLQPIINDAFTKGIAQTEPLVQAARLEVALLWFFYLSPLSETWTCGFVDVADCDSAWAYYNAAQTRDKLAGLGKYVNDLSPETHNRIFDGLLAERCWRDLDRDLPSKNAARYKQALDQLDKALLRGMALILRERIGKLGTTTGEAQKAHLTFVNILGDLLDRAARQRNAAQADLLKAQVSQTTAAQVDAPKATAALDALFPCP